MFKNTPHLEDIKKMIHFEKYELNIIMQALEKLGYPMIIKPGYKADNPGVYIVADKNWNILYIGEAKNIYTRLRKSDHTLKKKIKNFKFEDYNIISVVLYLDNFRFEVESILIAALRPMYNEVKYLHGCVKKGRR